MQIDPVTHPQSRLIKLTEVLNRLPVSRSAFYQGIKDGRYPPPVKIGERSSAWLESDIDALIAKAIVEAHHD